MQNYVLTVSALFMVWDVEIKNYCESDWRVSGESIVYGAVTTVQ